MPRTTSRSLKSRAMAPLTPRDGLQGFLVRPQAFAGLAAGRVAGLKQDAIAPSGVEAAPADRFQNPPPAVPVPAPVFNRGDGPPGGGLVEGGPQPVHIIGVDELEQAPPDALVGGPAEQPFARGIGEKDGAVSSTTVITSGIWSIEPAEEAMVGFGPAVRVGKENRLVHGAGMSRGRNGARAPPSGNGLDDIVYQCVADMRAGPWMRPVVSCQDLVT